MQTNQISVRRIYYDSDSAKTRSLLSQLKKKGWLGRVAAQLFRAQKYSTRAKGYRGGLRSSSGNFTSYRNLAYDGKGDAMIGLCDLMSESEHDLKWGWQSDPAQRFAKYVLYVDLPNGQVSFHSLTRFEGPDYDGQWDGAGASEQRIIEFCQSVIEG